MNIVFRGIFGHTNCCLICYHYFFCLSILVSYNLGLRRSRLLNSLEKFNLIDGLVLDIQASVPVQHSSNLTYHEIR